ncbi:STAS domain-containing protein [Rufibacter sp. LB8]|uniref:STAS domain-containing protein n=1 Tax=Rufibacter sp. LB8 TaxID=2777781 RepID=UPI00178C6A8E|nr:STAS domain-containing protein [Rufibacter sp. LB8]
MEIIIEEEPTAYILRLRGELDASTCLEVDKQIEIAMTKSVEHLWVDCQELRYISSAGLGVLISHLGTLEARSISLVLYGMSSQIKNVFELLGLHHLMTIVPSKEDALMQLR